MEHEKNTRETQAMTEVGHTTVSPALARIVVLGFLLVISVPLLIELFYHGRAESTFHPLSAVLDLPPSAREIATTVEKDGLVGGAIELNSAMGERMAAFETRLQNTSPLRDYLLTPLNRILSGTLGASNGDVFPGRDDWLFYGPALRHVVGPSIGISRDVDGTTRADDPVVALLNFRGALAMLDIELVVLPVPSKVSIYPEQFSASTVVGEAMHNAGWSPFLERLQEEGVLVCDLTDALMEAKHDGSAYLRHDSHWSPFGMSRAAKALADFLRDRGLIDGSLTDRDYGLGSIEEVTYRGDLGAMRYPDGTGSLDIGETVSIHPVLGRDGTPWAPDTSASVLLLGDSFTNIFSKADLGWGIGGGLAEYLSLYLQTPVDRISQNDNGAYATRMALHEDLNAGINRLENKRVVVYEFAARELSWGDWKPDISLEFKKGTDDSTGDDTMLSVSARIVGRSLPPTPGSVPYKDCTITLLVAPMNGGADLPEQFLVRGWGMRDHQWTTLTNWQVGDVVDLTLLPWSAVSDRVGSINQIPLDEENDVAEVFWLADEPTVEPVLPQALPDLVGAPAGASVGNTGLSDYVAELEGNETSVVRGEGAWMFLTPELRSLSVGTFSGEAAPRVSRSRNPAYADPFPAIVDFHQQLAAAGIQLILMPVPPKVGIYPDKVGNEGLAKDIRGAMGPDGAWNTFLQRLTEAGVHVIDLYRAFDGVPDEEKTLLYCQTDTHWAPRGIAIAAALAAAPILEAPWYGEYPKTNYTEQIAEISIEGDMTVMSGGSGGPEIVPITQVGQEVAGFFEVITPSRESPVLLIGDSHNLVFHAGGDMHVTGGGLPDLLARALGFPVDLVAVRGSGATTPRITLARRQDNMVGKKMVIWCFAAREFTESTTGWRRVPVVK